MEITKDKITEIFCIIDDFCKEYDAEIEKMAISEPNGVRIPVDTRSLIPVISVHSISNLQYRRQS